MRFTSQFSEAERRQNLGTASAESKASQNALHPRGMCRSAPLLNKGLRADCPAALFLLTDYNHSRQQKRKKYSNGTNLVPKKYFFFSCHYKNIRFQDKIIYSKPNDFILKVYQKYTIHSVMYLSHLQNYQAYYFLSTQRIPHNHLEI